MSQDLEVGMLKIRGKEYSLPVRKASIGPDVIDTTSLYKETKMFAYDVGFMSTAACTSSITYIDGETGILEYRGYSIKELAEQSNFLETAYLLLNGELPQSQELREFEKNIAHHSMVHEQIHCLFKGFKRSAHPMSIMIGGIGALSSFYHDNIDVNDKHQRENAIHRLIAKMPTLAAMAHKYTIGQPFIYPNNELSYTENFLHMMFSTPCEKYSIDPVLVNALDKIFILHADHEQNASTSTVRLVGSSGADPLACIAAGVASLWGPLHGGANEAVIKMLEEIGDVKNIPLYIDKAKDKSDSFRLMGFGHRVYKSYDPRAEVLRGTCHELLEHLGRKDDKLFKIALELEKIAMQDKYFIEKKLYPNVDFYSGIIYKALQIPVPMFTVLFAVARAVGWISHWKEMMEDPELKIGRPRQLYIGHRQRKYE